MKMKKTCIHCNKPMKKSYVKYGGIRFEAFQCPECKEKIFTEDMTIKAIDKLRTKRIEKEYIKYPIKIGHSWGLTFPKAITEIFNLDNSKTKLRIHPNLIKGKIEIDIK